MGVCWIALLFLTSGDSSCIQPGAFCTRGDLVLSGIVGAGMLVPPWLAASVLGELGIKSLLDNSNSKNEKQ